ncbi:hypothetical protein [uncultured Roseovarius sp.]|uniref:hypothetical protein n=1 Tax=uncultured Roseovarius sp. TaxID=293344 RepID=UPI0026112D41|nr:hypothetical protein [uncultured Roseovarius sp.]
MNKDPKPLYRTQMAKMAGITPVQLDYLVRLGVVAPDLGEVRKHYSECEARLAIVAGELQRFCKDAKSLKEPMDQLRCMVSWPERGVVPSYDEMCAQYSLEVFKKARDNGAVKSVQENLLRGLHRKFDRVRTEADVDQLASSARKWDQDQLDKAENAILFAGAASGLSDCFIITDINSLPWQWEMYSEPAAIDGAQTMLSIHVRSLFKNAYKRRGGEA